MRNVLADQLRYVMHVSGERKTRTEIAQQSGVNVYQIDAILSGDPAKHRPIHATEALSLAFVLGPRAVNALVGMIGYASASLDDAETQGPALAALGMIEQSARFARHALDNRIDHVERPDATEAADNIIDFALPYSSRQSVA